MKKLAALTLSLFLTTGTVLADTPKDPDPQASKQAPAKKPKAVAKTADKSAEIAAQLEEVRKALQSQQEQIQQLKNELARRDQQITEARNAASAADSKASEAAAKATEAAASSAEAKTAATAVTSDVNDLKLGSESVKLAVQDTQKKIISAEAPTAIHFKGISITPGGFLAAESASRTRSAQADVNTPFTGIPFPGNNLSKVSEFNASGRQSRLSFLFEGKADKVKLTGYYELDWLGTGVTSNNRQSNSYVMRQRQIWGQAALSNGWSFTGGQMWSLATETRKALDNRTEATPLTIDAQYNVGFTWARQYGFRVTKNFNNKAWFGFSVEAPQVTLTNHNSPTPFFVGAAGAGGGLLNFADTTGYSANRTPDFIVKAAFEPGWGHYEIFGIVSTFRNRVYPCGAAVTLVALPATCPGTTPSAANAFNDSRTGGGIGVNFRAPIDRGKKLDLGVHFFGGDGVGRYSSAQLPDVTARPDGTLALIRGGSALGTVEYHPNPKLDVYIDYGIEYAYRTAYTFLTNPAPPATPVTVAVGYGSPLFNNSGCEAAEPLPGGPFVTASASGCTGDLRNIHEGTIGFWHKLYQGPKGGVRWGIQYSYIFKNTWSGNNNTPAAPGVNGKAVDNMFFTSFRYYLP